MSLSVVWFKRDLRISDHAPLQEALSQGPVLPVYVIEPDYWEQPDTSLRQWQFLRESLLDLHEQLNRLGQPLWVAQDEMLPVLDEILEHHGPFRLYSHEEYAHPWCLERNRRVREWCQQKGIVWTEIPEAGITTQYPGARDWVAQWQKQMAEPLLSPPEQLEFVSVSPLRPEIWPDRLGADQTPCPQRQQGGRRSAVELLGSFLKQRGQFYSQDADDLFRAYDGGSRLSPFLAVGTISAREVFRQARKAHQHYKAKHKSAWARSMTQFVSTLLRRTHTLQRSRLEPDIAEHSIHRSFQGLGPEKPDKAILLAWMEGQTGFPLIDASMRALKQHGWLNPGLRELLISFVCQTLGCGWREPALYLARMSTDYDPGVFYPCLQDAAGTTGLRSWTFPDPVETGRRMDPEGKFVKSLCPALAELEGDYLLMPWTQSEAQQVMAGCVIGVDYPAPLCRVEEAVARSRARVEQRLADQWDRSETQRVLDQHWLPVLDPALPVQQMMRDDATAYMEYILSGN